MVEALMQDLYRICVPLPGNPLKELNSYLIRGEGRSLLIDTGFRQPACRRALEAGLEELGVERDRLDIFLTHLHSDHSGLAPDLIAPGRSICISAADRSKVENAGEIAAHWDAFRRRYLAAGISTQLMDEMDAANPAIQWAPRQGCGQYVSVKDGDVLSIGGYRLKCILTPGHTPGHMCLWDEEKRLFFSGDHVLFDITPNITIWPDAADALGDYMASLKQVRALPVERTLPGHRATGDFHTRVDALLAHHETRLAEVEAIVSGDPGRTAYEIASQMTWRIRAKNWAEFPKAQKFFAVGECLAHLDHLCAQGRIRCTLLHGVGRYER